MQSFKLESNLKGINKMNDKADAKELIFTNNLVDKILKRNSLYEMTNLYPRTTKLPYTVWISTKGKAKHEPRIKVDAPQEVVISISDEPKIIHGELKTKDFEEIKQWILLNKEILMRHWNGETDGAEVSNELILHRIENTPICFENSLMEMANLEPEETGLDYLIWIGSSPAVHGDRIKVVLEKGKVTSKNSFSLSIQDEPEIVAGNADSLSAKELKKIKSWIKQNKENLIKHANAEITDRQFRKLSKKV